MLYELFQQTAPLAAEDVCSSEAAVSTAHAQVGDAFLHQVKSCSKPALASREDLAPGTSDHSPTLQPFELQTNVIVFSVTSNSIDISEMGVSD